MISGVIPPNAVEIEKLVIGSMLIDSKALDKSINFLGEDPQVFYDPKHQEIYRAILNLKNNNNPVDMATVIVNLKEKKSLSSAGGDSYIIELTLGISSSAHIAYHCRIVTEKYFKRKMIDTCTNLISKAYQEDNDVFELLDRVSYETNKIYDTISGQKQVMSAHDLHLEFIEGIKEGRARGVKIPFRKMNESFYGWQPSDLIIIGARPGMGKTAYATELAKGAAKEGFPVLFFSLEMANIQIHKRLVANELGIASDDIQKHKFSQSDMSKIYQTTSFQKMPLYFEDSVSKIDEILSRARVAKKEQGIKLLVIDYLQLIEAKGKAEGNEKTTYVSRKLKLLAKELNIPVISLSQLSRAVENRPGKRPQLSDLRESGAIEQDADVIQFIYRPEYYNIPTWHNEWDGIKDLPTDGEAEVITAKHRHCGTSRTRLKWEPSYQKFTDIDATDFNYQNNNNVPTADPDEAFPY